MYFRFSALHKRLEAAARSKLLKPRKIRLPRLTSKKLIKKLSQQFVEKRRRKLNEYMKV